MREETNLSYLSAFFYTAAVLLLLTTIFAALNRSWSVAIASFLLGGVLFGYQLRRSKASQ